MKALIKGILLGLIFLGNVSASEVGFSVGDHLLLTEKSGDVVDFCWNDGQQRGQRFECEESRVRPSLYSSFVYSGGEKVDLVRLKVLWPNNRGWIKTSSRMGPSGESAVRFNLANRGLFKKPLLRLGVNRVEYKLFFDGENVKEGSFDFNYTKESYNCESMTLPGRVGSCQTQSRACNDYFELNPVCRLE